jgi:hypothetical protein
MTKNKKMMKRELNENSACANFAQDENEITALAGGGFGISMGSSSPGLGTLASIANGTFASTT